MLNIKSLKLFLLIIGLVVTCILNNAFCQKKLPKQDLVLLNGDTLKRDSLSGKVVVINIWGTWCKPCVAEIPDLNELKQNHSSDDNIIFIAAATGGSKDKLENFLKNREFNFTHLSMNTAALFMKGFAHAFPTTLIYNRQGELLKKFKGQLKGESMEELKAIINKEKNT